MNIKLDDDVPMPTHTRAGAGTAKYPFEGMNVNQSFFVEGKTRQQMDNACGHWRKSKGWKFTIEGGRTEEVEDPDGSKRSATGTRVWRAA